MYKNCVQKLLEEARSVELLYLGEKYLFVPHENGITVTNCRTGVSGSFENIQALCSDSVFYTALHEEDYSKVWVGLVDNILFASKDEFVANLMAGCEIECIYCGVGFFIGPRFGTTEPTWQLYNAYLHESQYFRSPADLWEHANMLGRPLQACIEEVEIIAYL